MDFSVYALPVFVTKLLGTPFRWTNTDFFDSKGNLDEKRSPLFLFGTENTIAYNWFDAGNWLWGNAVNRLGGTSGDAYKWATKYNKNDSFADISAILNGWYYHSGFRSYRNIPKK